MNEIKLILENLTEEEREQLMGLVKKANKKKEKVWKPVYGDIYYVIETDGYIDDDHMWEDEDYDESCYKLGNCYKTKEDVEFAVEKQKIEVELQRFAEEYNENGFDVFDTNRKKHYIGCFCSDGELCVNNNCTLLMGDVVYFSSEEIAKQAIKTIGENRIKKYIFGVK